MRLIPTIAQKIADRYNGFGYYGNKPGFDKALADVIRRQGGLCAALNDDARRDLILTLGDHRRANARTQARIAARREQPIRMAAE